MATFTGATDPCRLGRQVKPFGSETPARILIPRCLCDPCRLVRQVKEFGGQRLPGRLPSDPCRLVRQVKLF